mmetsp:Transcript_105070/g.338837  ORF Transcript_105070/g.338837 Transcript_105070/m.338837 type:complete len:504 (+) Transcript_105070:79-1590(+)
MMVSPSGGEFAQECFILGNVNAQGFLIRHASPGFRDLFGYSAAECVGQESSTLVGSPSIARSVPSLFEAARASSLAPEEAAARLCALSQHAAEEARAAVPGAGGRAGFSLLLGRKRDGELLVCELTVRAYKHPLVGLPYCLGLYRDVTAEVSVAQLLTAATGRCYASLLAGRDASKEQHHVTTLDKDAFVKSLHEAATSMWRNWTIFSRPSPPDDGYKKPIKASMASRETRSVRSEGSLPSYPSGDETGEIASDESFAEHGTPCRLWIDPFMDLLDAVGDHSEDENAQPPTSPTVLPAPSGPQQTAARELTICALRCRELYDLGFALAVADPSRPGCPLVACSSGFSRITGYAAEEALGQDCGFLLRDVPPGLLGQCAQGQGEALCAAAGRGEYFAGAGAPEGEFVCTQMGARSSGRLFRSLRYLKQAELDNCMFVLELLALLPEPDNDPEDTAPKLTTALNAEETHRAALEDLHENMSQAEQLLASRFWYCASMRRQVPCGA